ncbi:MAG: hypothetical protein KDJ73_12090 [Notoacmeibacter sp.]|nr:hypothetical protein [Notoacmeibacter sp.]MCC0032160.1 hypothetical protein [Brucellaceae bacterium]
MTNRLNRRRFLAAGAGFAALLAFPASATSPFAPQRPEWAARLIKGDDGGTLLEITGGYWAMSTGWKVWLEEGIMTRSEPPALLIQLRKTAPDGRAGQALIYHKVSLRLPALPAYRAIRVMDGETPLAQFKDLVQ